MIGAKAAGGIEGFVALPPTWIAEACGDGPFYRGRRLCIGECGGAGGIVLRLRESGADCGFARMRQRGEDRCADFAGGEPFQAFGVGRGETHVARRQP